MSDLFTGTAEYYAKYRDFYPDEIISDIVSKFDLAKTDRILDFGSGTGQLAIQLSKYVEGVVAVEPDSDMISEGKKLANQHDAENIRWTHILAEDIGDAKDIGTFKLVTFATSFHWMDQEKVLKLIEPLVEPTGGLVLTGSQSVWQSKVPWQAVVEK